MRRVASGFLVASGLATAAMGAGCGGGEFTAGPPTDSGGAAESSAPSGIDASTEPPTGSDAGDERDVTVGSRPDAGPVVSSDASMPTSGCPAGRGPAMVLVDGFCIDSTEVTSAQYNAFLLAGPSLSAQPPECSWNTAYLPGNGWTYTPAEATLPIANVNWCDAYAFCAWAGKRMCGKLGGGAASFTLFASKDNEHYLACSNVSTRIYPYGNSYEPAACNGPEHDAGHVLPVGSLSGCQGGVAGLFDMSGNVEEWENACSGTSGAGDMCLDGTGAFDYGDPPSGTRCDFGDYDTRNGEFGDVGIRCCATPP